MRDPPLNRVLYIYEGPPSRKQWAAPCDVRRLRRHIEKIELVSLPPASIVFSVDTLYP